MFSRDVFDFLLYLIFSDVKLSLFFLESLLKILFIKLIYI